MCGREGPCTLLPEYPGQPCAEVSWQIDQKGRPIPTSGAFRYPISYSGGGENAKTLLGVNFSAPFMSDTTRHGLAVGADTRNQELIEECEAATVRILRQYLVPRHGPLALRLLEDPAEQGAERSLRVVLEAAEYGALPATEINRHRRGRQRTSRLLPIADETENSTFVVPTYSWDPKSIPSTLSTLVPETYEQLHPDSPDFVIRALVERPNVGESTAYVVFDEHDVIERFSAPDFSGQ